MLPHTKSPIPHCTRSEITRQQRCEQYLKHTATQTVTCRLLAHKAQTPLGRFFCRRIIQASLQQIHKKSNRWSLTLSVLAAP